MKRKLLGGVVTAVGVVLFAVAVLANQLGVGNTSSFGWKQTTVAILGGVVTVVGLGVLVFGRSGA